MCPSMSLSAWTATLTYLSAFHQLFVKYKTAVDSQKENHVFAHIKMMQNNVKLLMQLLKSRARNLFCNVDLAISNKKKPNLCGNRRNFDQWLRFQSRSIGSAVILKNAASEAIKDQISLANRCLDDLCKQLSSRDLFSMSKLLLYKSNILSLVFLFKTEEAALKVFEQWILWKIFVPEYNENLKYYLKIIRD